MKKLPVLKFLKGPLAGETLKPRSFKRLTFGGDGAEVSFGDPELPAVHFRLEQRGGAVWLVDLDSPGRTTVNGVRQAEARLFHEDLVEAGGHCFAFLHPDHARPGATTYVISSDLAGGGGESVVRQAADQIIEGLSPEDGRPSAESALNKLLYALSNLSVRELDGGKLAAASLETIVKALHASRGALLNGKLEPVALFPDRASCRSLFEPPLLEILREALRRGVSLSRKAGLPGAAGEVAAWCAPLRGYEGIAGAIYVDNSGDPAAPVPPGTASILALLGRQLGLALDRARLIREKFLSEEKYRFLVEKAHDCIFQLDGAGRFDFASARAEAVFGRSAASLAGLELAELSVPELKEGVRAKLETLLEKRGAEPFEMELVKADGSRGTLAVSLASLEDERGRTYGLIGVGRDITRERKLQEAVYQSERLASLGKLVAGVGHELNNPLTSVIGFTQLMLRDPALPAPHRKRLEMISSEGERARTIITNLLTFARPPRASKGPVNVVEVLQQTLTLLKSDIERARTELLTFLEPAPPVTGDPSQLMEVFTNIIVNALQAISSSGKPGRLIAKVWLVEKTVHVSFSDDGPGIDPGNLARIFDPFFTTKEVGEGSGLGLSMCYRIINSLGGSLSVDSAPGEGATFEITLPA